MPSLFSHFMQATVLRYPRSALLAVAVLTLAMAAGIVIMIYFIGL